MIGDNKAEKHFSEMTEQEKYECRILKPNPQWTSKSLSMLPSFFNGLQARPSSDYFCVDVKDLQLPDNCVGIRVAAVVCKFGFMDSKVVIKEF